MQVHPTASHYIHGRYVDDIEGELIPVHFPGTNEVIASVRSATPDIVKYAIESAKTAQADWAKIKPSERGRILYRAAEILIKKNDHIAYIETLNTGRTLQETLSCDVICLSDIMKFFGGVIASFNGDFINLGESFAYTRREPLGVCVGIGAWNYPIYCAGAKAIPALAMGNSMVFKPSELTPLSALILAESLSEAGLPDGLFNVIQGGADVGEMLIQKDSVAKISFTGSLSSGSKVMALAGEHIKHTTMELGGKSPLIIFDDAHIDNALHAIMMANFYSNGQICSNGTRVFVQKNIEKKILSLLCERVTKITIGNPLDPEIKMGPLINKKQQEKILFYINTAKEEGATLLYGGTIPRIEKMEEGFFITPTIFSNVKDHMLIAKEEIFGPLVSVFSFETEEEVVARANNTDYGLAAGVFTSDLTRAHRVVAALQAGICWINNYNLMPVEIPFGGFKKSGIGRENALAALEDYSQLKSIYVEMKNVHSVF